MDEPWNTDGSLLAIQNDGSDGGSPTELFLDGSTYQVKFGASNLPGGGGDDRWNVMPGHANERVVAGWPGSTLYWFNVVTNQVTASWQLPFPVVGIDEGFGNTSADGRYVFLIGQPSSTGNLKGFVLDMVANKIGPAIDFNDGHTPADGSTLSTSDTWASISPSGKYVVLRYDGGPNAMRVYDVNPTTLAVTPHPEPTTWTGQSGPGSLGFIYNVGEPDMALNPFNGNSDVIIGQEHAGNEGTNISGIKTVNSDGIGHVVMVDLATNAVTSLTDPGNGSTVPYEAYAFHVSARNVNRPGWVYVSYYIGNDSGGDRFNEEIMAVKMDGSGSVERFAQSHSDWENATGTTGQYSSKDSDYDYRSQPHEVPSPDGKRVIFASNWVYHGNGGQGIEDYVIDTGL